MRNRAIAYLRVSTDEQASSGAGLNAQLDSCKAHAQRYNLELAGTFSDEGISGAASLDKRPGLLEAISQLGKNDVFLVAKRDRLGRDPIVVAMIEASIKRKGARIVSVAGEGTDNDEPTSVLMRRMVDAFSEYERLIIKARTKAALQAKKRRNERVGNLPFGFQLAENGICLVPNPEEQASIARIIDLRATGFTLREIADELNRDGIMTRRGSTWHHVYVANILKAA